MEILVRDINGNTLATTDLPQVDTENEWNIVDLSQSARDRWVIITLERMEDTDPDSDYWTGVRYGRDEE